MGDIGTECYCYYMMISTQKLMKLKKGVSTWSKNNVCVVAIEKCALGTNFCVKRFALQ